MLPVVNLVEKFYRFFYMYVQTMFKKCSIRSVVFNLVGMKALTGRVIYGKVPSGDDFFVLNLILC